MSRAKALASERRQPLRRVLEEALVLLLRQQGRAPEGGIKLRKHSFGGRGLGEAVRDRSWEGIRELAYGERGGAGSGRDRH
ncbi:hypothetical protein JCM17961_34740 [Endothiovibrio diazotrophicus]